MCNVTFEGERANKCPHGKRSKMASENSTQGARSYRYCKFCMQDITWCVRH